jgi:ClpP class serine protease
MFAKIRAEQDVMRRKLISEIQEITGRKMISYVANVDAPLGNTIDYNDTMAFNDLLTVMGFPENLDLLLHSIGGTVEATQKLVLMLRDKVKSLRVIIPEMAKSAATLLAFASNEILMSYMAELGPIDPQVLVGYDQAGRPIYRPAWSVLHSVESAREELKKGDPSAGVLLQRIDPTH